MPEILSPLGDGDRRKANEYSRKAHEQWRRRQRESERDRQRKSEQDRRHSRPSPGPDRREPRDRVPPRSRSRPRPYPDSKPTEEPRPSSSRQSQDTNPGLKRWATDLIFTLMDWTCSSIHLAYKILLLTRALLPMGLLKLLIVLGLVLCEWAMSTPFILESARQFACSPAPAESPSDQAQFIADSLDGCGPVVPDILTYMTNVGEDVEDKANEIKDLLEVSDIDLSSAQWKSDYNRATELLRTEESTVRAQQQQLWMEIDRYLRQFTHSAKQADTSFWSSITGGNTSGQLKINPIFP
ncbi:uncharacterized protein NECHADRAFT_89471 [Fusarium vanettenii 77-13-4]|uniref:Uncharacterized protein n=1 Tax=Fusarium vanettenii (strain ATCC MYA-4622 / CBS 123669 / FGSC 9596 / NRRL 45880 / 77-13-4) TaxID=660122 RepID=C7ZRA3_FUSV7|nr:uncharacterized protein NECHADRAFT_89471 [Fusarium vanettenii 77-13-4]EEU33453.1 predicted protein [Fusarium vanettenii 77-13-4]